MENNFIQALVDPRKLADYVFKARADHGKDTVFMSLGYGKQHADKLATLYRTQGLEKFKQGQFTLGKKDQYGQRIDLEVELPNLYHPLATPSYIKSGWLIRSDGNIKLNTPFAGFTRKSIMLDNYSRIRLTSPHYDREGVPLGSMGYLIETYPDGAYEVEFSAPDGTTIAQLVLNEA